MDQIDKTSNSITALSAKGFGELGFSERAHLQEWIAKCPECLGEELLIIAKEFDGFDETKERLDDIKASRISYAKGFDGRDKENWPEMIAWLAEHIQKLEKAFSPWVPKLAGWIRDAEVSNTGAFQEEVEL